jgi:hypothetical protein
MTSIQGEMCAIRSQTHEYSSFFPRFVRKDGKKPRGFVDVLEKLGNRTLIFAGDSVGSQVSRLSTLTIPIHRLKSAPK